MGACAGKNNNDQHDLEAQQPLVSKEIKVERPEEVREEEASGFWEHSPVDASTWRELFGYSVCCDSEYPFLAWRLLLTLCMIAITVFSLYEWNVEGVDDDTDNDGKFGEGIELKYWFIFLTHWGLMFETFYFVMALGTTYLAVFSTDGIYGTTDVNAAPWYVDVTWKLQATMLVVSFMIFVMYWGLVYEGTLYFCSTLTHGANFALMYADHLVSKQPLKFRHMIYPVLFATCYLVFTLVYYYAGGTYYDGKSRYVYKAIDWAHPGYTAGLCCGLIFVVAPVIWLLMYSVSKCKAKCC